MFTMVSTIENTRLFLYRRVPVNHFGKITEEMPYQIRQGKISALLLTIPPHLPTDVVIENFLLPWMNEHDQFQFTADHMIRVANNALQFGIAYGKMYPDKRLSKKELSDLYYAALLHDIGKLAVPNTIFQEKHGLSPIQSAINRSHPDFTFYILDHIPCLRHLAQPASLHHEFWNGTGPFQLKEEQIPLITQIISLADAFDYIVSKRPHFPAQPISYAFDVLRRDAGKFYSTKLITVMDQVRYIFSRDPQIKKF